MTDEFLAELQREKTIAIVRADTQEVAGSAMQAAIDGGMRIVEFTLNTPGALALVTEFSRRNDLWVGAGTVLDVPAARTAVEAGARFLVSPIVDEEMIAAAQEMGIPIMPGTCSPTEMFRAHRAGAPLQKLFPAPGPAFVRYCLGPMPFLKIVPTSGVTEANAVDFLQAGAFALGLGSVLFAVEDLAARRYEPITERAQRLRARLTAR